MPFVPFVANFFLDARKQVDVHAAYWKPWYGRRPDEVFVARSFSDSFLRLSLGLYCNSGQGDFVIGVAARLVAHADGDGSPHAHAKVLAWL